MEIVLLALITFVLLAFSTSIGDYLAWKFMEYEYKRLSKKKDKKPKR
jgi:hypothetical protein